MQRQSNAATSFIARFIVVSIVSFFFLSNVKSQDNETAERTDGSRTSLFQPVAIACEGLELASFLRRFSERCDFEYFIDRRVDPTTPISGTFSDAPLIDALRKMTEDAGLSFCCVDGSFVWIGPRDASGELLLLFALKREELDSWPPKIAEKMSSRLDFSIAEFAEPRDAFQSLSKRLKTKFVGFEKTPFDRWRGAKFRDVVASDLTSTLLFGFGVDYRWDESANGVKPISLDKTREVERLYPKRFVQKLDRKSFDGCVFSNDANAETVKVVGTFADVARVEYAVALLVDDANRPAPSVPRQGTTRSERGGARAATRSGKGRKEVSGSIQNKTLRDAFAYLETNLGKTFSLDSSLAEENVTLDKRITCEFKNADETKIAATIADKIGATFQIDGDRVVFSASKKR